MKMEREERADESGEKPPGFSSQAVVAWLF
jgi:hypothetical protein